MNLPLAKRVIEILTIEPDPHDAARTLVRYTGSFEPYVLARLTAGRTKRQMSESWSAALLSLSGHLAG